MQREGVYLGISRKTLIGTFPLSNIHVCVSPL